MSFTLWVGFHSLSFDLQEKWLLCILLELAMFTYSTEVQVLVNFYEACLFEAVYSKIKLNSGEKLSLQLVIQQLGVH